MSASAGVICQESILSMIVFAVLPLPVNGCFVDFVRLIIPKTEDVSIDFREVWAYFT